MSSTVRQLIDGFLRGPGKADEQVAYWAGRLDDAKSGKEALNVTWSWTLGALADAGRRRPQKAEAARWHLARILALFAAQLPGAEIPLRAGLTEDEAARLFDPWGDRQEVSR